MRKVFEEPGVERLKADGAASPRLLGAERKYIGLNGYKQFFRCMGKLAEHSLAIHDDKLGRAGYSIGSANYMFKLIPLHGFAHHN